MSHLYANVRSRLLRLVLFLIHLPIHTVMLIANIAACFIFAFSNTAAGTLGLVQTNIRSLVVDIVTGMRNIVGDLIAISTNPSPVVKVEAGVDLVKNAVEVVSDDVKLVDAVKADVGTDDHPARV